jgi:hypothetical protein
MQNKDYDEIRKQYYSDASNSILEELNKMSDRLINKPSPFRTVLFSAADRSNIRDSIVFDKDAI